MTKKDLTDKEVDLAIENIMRELVSYALSREKKRKEIHEKLIGDNINYFEEDYPEKMAIRNKVRLTGSLIGPIISQLALSEKDADDFDDLTRDKNVTSETILSWINNRLKNNKTLTLELKKDLLADMANSFFDKKLQEGLHKHRDHHLPEFIKNIVKWFDKLGLTYVKGRQVTAKVGKLFDKVGIGATITTDHEKTELLLNAMQEEAQKNPIVEVRNNVKVIILGVLNCKVDVHKGKEGVFDIKITSDYEKTILERLFKNANLKPNFNKDKDKDKNNTYHYSIAKHYFDKICPPLKNQNKK